MAEEKKIYLYHHDRTVKTLKDFMEKERIKFVTLDDLWNENKDFIFSQMSLADKTAYKESNGKFPESGSDLSSGMTLPCPCKLRVNPHGITAEVAISQTNFQENTDDFYSFENEQIQDVLNEAQSAFVDKSSPDVQIYAWSKALSFIHKFQGTENKNNLYSQNFDAWIDLSRFIISATTSVSGNGGSFTIRLPFLNIDSLGNWSDSGEFAPYIKEKNFGKQVFESEKFLSGRENAFFKREKTMMGQKSKDYFSTILASNDLLFISFKKEDVIDDPKNWNGILFDKDAEEVISQTSFDMVALIDDVKVVHSGQAEASVEISGRDLMKLITDDGSFFFNPSVCSDPSFVFYNYANDTAQGDLRDVSKITGNKSVLYNGDSDEEGKQYAINRLRGVANEIDIFRSPLNNSIDFIIKGVISQLANIEVVPSSIFNKWSNKTTWNELKPEGND